VLVTALWSAHSGHRSAPLSGANRVNVPRARLPARPRWTTLASLSRRQARVPRLRAGSPREEPGYAGEDVRTSPDEITSSCSTAYSIQELLSGSTR
jgi:hypothetical protein